MKKSNVIKIDGFFDSWKKVFEANDPVNGTSLTIYSNGRTKQFDVVQTNDEGESITTHLTADSGLNFVRALQDLHD